MNETETTENDGKPEMKVVEISGGFWVVREEPDGRLVRLDGLYPERSWAESMSRIREI